jgi:hypothetical protein
MPASGFNRTWLKKNNMEIAAVMSRWLAKEIPGAARKTP